MNADGLERSTVIQRDRSPAAQDSSCARLPREAFLSLVATLRTQALIV